eukprot:TRINITY_DN28728_c0_g1_i1.p2 TRINITY_DN28728_c0_g1~~TRINITY_DN28728_c0_g1_i1.p2  ORF type:complete len:134 (-),score=29.77 TRINITY_DN28728_c0_g1_i1:118-519(-)
MFMCCSDSAANTSAEAVGAPVVEMGAAPAPEVATKPGSAAASSGGEFTVEVEKTGGIKIGLDISAVGQKVLKVWKIKEGLIADWNKGQPEDLQVKPGDAVIKVNDCEGCSDDLLKQIATESKMTIVFSRGMFA